MRPRRLARSVFRELSDGTGLVLQPDGAAAHVLNETASVIWTLCDGTRRSEEIAEVISSSVQGAALEQVRKDVQALLGQLMQSGLIEDLDACGPPASGR